MSKVYSLKTFQKIPITLDEAWDFFSIPKNLSKITPDNMGFNIISKYHGEKMYEDILHAVSCPQKFLLLR